MKQLSALTLAVCLLASPVSAAIDGAWTANLNTKHPDRLSITMTSAESRHMGVTRPIAEFGLTPAQLNAASSAPVRFELRREAGTIAFDGTFAKGNGAGQFHFTPQPAALDAIRNLGIDMEPEKKRKERSEEDTLFTLAIFDVSTTFIRTMIAEGFKVSLDQYVAMRIFDVTPEYIHEMRSLGFRDIDDDDLIATRIHGVTPQYIRETRAAGWDLDLDELQATRIHGATPEFAAAMKRLGYDLSQKDLVAFRIHGVTPEFIESMRKLGYSDLTAKQLVTMRIHGVTPKFIAEVEQAGYVKVPVDKLVAMRIHGIDGKMLAKMAK